MTAPFPARILALANQAGGEPLAWSENETGITIVFVDGRKLRFEKVAETIILDDGEMLSENVTQFAKLRPSDPVETANPQSEIRIPQSTDHAQSTPIVQTVPKKAPSKSTRKEKKSHE